jgi:hypothetical protein
MTRLTQSGLCTAASNEGYPVSGEQFHERLEWGLLPQPDEDGKWDAEVARALIRAQQLWTNESVHALPRRALRMRCEGFPIPDEKVLAALRAVAPTIQQPSRKMKATAWARQILANPAAIARKRNRIRPSERPPAASTWKDLLNRINVEAVAKRTWVWCHVASALRSLPFRPEDEVGEIPIEELMTLLAVQDLAAVEHAAGIENATIGKSPRR